MTYDAIDRALLAALRADSALHLREYAAKTSIPKSTVHERLHRLSKTGVHCISLIDFAQVGCPVQAIFLVPVPDEVLCALWVNSVYHVSPNQYLVCGVFSSLKALEDARVRLGAKRCYPVIEVLKYEGFLPF